MSEPHLMLHCGGREVSAAELALVPCPKPDGRWVPVAHKTVLDHCTAALHDAGYEIDTIKLGLSRSDQRFFGVLNLTSSLVSGVGLAVGIRSSLDKSLALGWCCGHRVTVCDNLAFASSKVIARRHTTHGVLRYQEAICKAVGELAEYREQEAARIRDMRHRLIADHLAESWLLRLYQDEQILSPRTLPVALKEWREPSFPEFGEGRNVWRLYNAVTFALADRHRTNPQAHAAATIRLSALLAPPTTTCEPAPEAAESP